MEYVDCDYSEGAGSGDAQLSWAQRFMWDAIAATGAVSAEWDMVFEREFPHPLPLEAALDLVRRFVLRHPVLRTAITLSPDGTPVQHVRASGTVGVALFRGSYTGRDQLWGLIPDTTPAEPFVPVLYMAGAQAVRLAVAVSHFSTDGWGRQLLKDDLLALPLEDTADVVPSTPSPIDLARFESSEEGAAAERKAMKFAGARYASCLPTAWLRHRCPPEPVRFWYGELRSSALLAAMDRLSRSKRVVRAGMLNGSLAAVAAARAGLAAATLFAISSNRFSPAWRDYPGPLAQEAILHVPIKDTVVDTMRAAAAESMRSMQCARYAPAAMKALFEQAEWERGVCFDKLGSAIVVNLMAGETSTSPAPTPTSTTFRWLRNTGNENLAFYVDAAQEGPEFVLQVRLDTTRMTRAEAEAWLRTVEWAIVASAERDVPAGEVRTHLAALLGAADNGEGWAGEGHRLLMAGCEKVVRAATGADEVHLERDTCYVVNPKRATTPAEMHKAVMAALPDAQPAVAPQWYVVVPAGLDRSRWSGLPAVSGR
ncbi:hypothetical protein [Actinocrispum sp. NPDC049592]|uniref:hypothetical protein n=1 Tax=Actinocrispum sp. NPDC049592 TaxID=3154835 RepID=UPI00341AB090